MSASGAACPLLADENVLRASGLRGHGYDVLCIADVGPGVDDPAVLAPYADTIAVFYLPSYAPELNFDECLNVDLKLCVAKWAPARNRDDLLRTATARLCSLQRRPAQVKKFFRHPPSATRRDVS